MTHGMSGRHRQPAFGDRHIEVATGHSHRPHDRLFRPRDAGIRRVSPGIFAGRLEHQLLHVGTLL
jgi:hypothetical protein